MRFTNIVTSFVVRQDKVLILRRSAHVKSMKGLWAGISGIIEGDEDPLVRAKIEIFEETGIPEEKLRLVRRLDSIRVASPQYENHEWSVSPFLFEAGDVDVTLNWENSEFRWIDIDELDNYRTVPSLKRILTGLLDKQVP